MLIFISDAFDQSLPDLISKHGEVTTDKGRLAEAEVVLIRSKTKVTSEYIDSAPELKLVIRGGVGLDNVDQTYAKQKGIKVFNTADASAIAVAELAMTLMLSITNHVVPADVSMHEGKWLKKELKRTELHGKTLGIIGLGRIGTEVARRANAFGMKCLAYDPYVDHSDEAELRPELEAVFGASDYISLHLPLTDSTRGIINKERLAGFKDGAFLINSGRGKCIVEEDLVEALKSGRLAGFATDVFYSDPQPEDSPLRGAPNVLMTPHIGSSTKENMLRIGEIIDRLIGEHVAGK